MFENISYKKKFWILIGLLVILSFTAYKRSFRLTIEAKASLNETKSKLETVSNSRYQIANLEAEVAYLDNIIGKKAGNASLVQQEILNTFALIDTEAEIVRLEEIHKSQNEYFNIYTNRLVLSGPYQDLLETTYSYEKEFEFSRVVSLNFYVDRERRTRRKKLFQQLIFQNYEKIP